MRKVVKGVYEWSKLILFAMIAAFLLKNNVVASALVPTGSMEQTVMTGSRIIINRLAYVYHEPQRGDIVTFYYPDDGETLYLKRIMGLPGEVIEGIDGKVYIDGKLISDFTQNKFYVDFGPYEIPEGCYFMMGDNRSNSWDSRYWTNKFVEIGDIIGKAEFEYYPEIKVLK
ncbi:MAG: signal peptidase I [Lachnospiraceae bacterium]|nr:signal peptidase I [Lachnospiraceae bacterium]